MCVVCVGGEMISHFNFGERVEREVYKTRVAKKRERSERERARAMADVTPLPRLHAVTPLLRSVEMTSSLRAHLAQCVEGKEGGVDGCSAPLATCWVKMDCVQPGGSFKIRGIGRLAVEARQRGVNQLLSSSGGNAGMATAYAASVLEGMAATVVVPSTTPKFAREKIRSLGASVVVHGDVWDEADKHSRILVEEAGGKACHVHPFEHPLIWEGHATMIDEIKEQMVSLGVKKPPAAVVVAVGGGGLLIGVLQGLKRNQWDNVPVIAAETRGAHSFARAMEEGKAINLEGGITSLAKSLGATKVSANAVAKSQAHIGGVHNVVVSDAAAVSACCSFGDDQRSLVEPACGAALAAAAYDGSGVADGIAKILAAGDGIASDSHIVVICCGGNIVTRDMLETWTKQTGASS